MNTDKTLTVSVTNPDGATFSSVCQMRAGYQALTFAGAAHASSDEKSWGMRCGYEALRETAEQLRREERRERENEARYTR